MLRGAGIYREDLDNNFLDKRRATPQNVNIDKDQGTNRVIGSQILSIWQI